MFTEKISMNCTRSQYEKYLRKPLLEMGYIECGLDWCKNETILVSNMSNGMGCLGSLSLNRKLFHDRKYLGSFDANLFLELASKTDDSEGQVKNIETKMKTIKVTRGDLQRVHEVACSDWKDRIESYIWKYGTIFSNEIFLPEGIVEEMFRAAGSNDTQLTALSQAFPEYQGHKDPNVLKPLSVESPEWNKVDHLLSELSKAWRRDVDGKIFYLTNGLAGTKTELVGRSIAIPSQVAVKLHKGVAGCTLIELVDK